MRSPICQTPIWTGRILRSKRGGYYHRSKDDSPDASAPRRASHLIAPSRHESCGGHGAESADAKTYLSSDSKSVEHTRPHGGHHLSLPSLDTSRAEATERKVRIRRSTFRQTQTANCNSGGWRVLRFIMKGITSPESEKVRTIHFSGVLQSSLSTGERRMENADYWGLNPRRQPSKARSKASASYPNAFQRETTDLPGEGKRSRMEWRRVTARKEQRIEKTQMNYGNCL
jgi:hypothetical protein